MTQVSFLLIHTFVLVPQSYRASYLMLSQQLLESLWHHADWPVGVWSAEFGAGNPIGTSSAEVSQSLSMRICMLDPKNKLTWWRMRRNRFGHFEWICRRAFSPSLTMCFSNFWCASVCFSGVERQMQLRVWMSKAFSDAFREVFKVGTILCWYCSSSLRFFFAPFATCIFCARDLIGCGQDADTFGFS